MGTRVGHDCRSIFCKAMNNKNTESQEQQTRRWCSAAGCNPAAAVEDVVVEKDNPDCTAVTVQLPRANDSAYRPLYRNYLAAMNSGTPPPARLDPLVADTPGLDLCVVWESILGCHALCFVWRC